MTQRFGNIFETALGYSRSTVVRTYTKWWMPLKPAVDDVVLDVQTLWKKKVFGDFPACWSKTGDRQWLNWQYKKMLSQVEMHRKTLFSSHGWIWDYAADVTHTCAFVCQASSPTTPTLGPGTSRLAHPSVEESCLVRWIKICDLSRRWQGQDATASRRIVVLSMYSKSHTGQWWRSYSLRGILLGIFSNRGCGKTDFQSYEVSEQLQIICAHALRLSS